MKCYFKIRVPFTWHQYVFLKFFLCDVAPLWQRHTWKNVELSSVSLSLWFTWMWKNEFYINAQESTTSGKRKIHFVFGLLTFSNLQRITNTKPILTNKFLVKKNFEWLELAAAHYPIETSVISMLKFQKKSKNKKLQSARQKSHPIIDLQ